MRKQLGFQQGRIHGNPVADGWAGAVMQNRSELKNVMDGPTDRHGKVLSRVSATKKHSS